MRLHADLAASHLAAEHEYDLSGFIRVLGVGPLDGANERLVWRFLGRADQPLDDQPARPRIAVLCGLDDLLLGEGGGFMARPLGLAVRALLPGPNLRFVFRPSLTVHPSWLRGGLGLRSLARNDRNARDLMLPPRFCLVLK
jgi:hypothetical protein